MKRFQGVFAKRVLGSKLVIHKSEALGEKINSAAKTVRSPVLVPITESPTLFDDAFDVQKRLKAIMVKVANEQLLDLPLDGKRREYPREILRQGFAVDWLRQEHDLVAAL